MPRITQGSEALLVQVSFAIDDCPAASFTKPLTTSLAFVPRLWGCAGEESVGNPSHLNITQF
ncbi:unnamed protein product [Periconia digitata]|uniref:Uncharacterized protein n=1 Tax=Periconia digitata TaxID=1303443 RepID=A0A9W4UQ72_9PLEO|nr:unnamed protein product [Periconia digitata]